MQMMPRSASHAPCDLFGIEVAPAQRLRQDQRLMLVGDEDVDDGEQLRIGHARPERG